MIVRRQATRPMHHTGFTLVEVLIVIMLLALLAGMTYPLFKSDTPNQKLQRSTDRLSSLMAMCRAEAMLQGHPFRLTWPTLIEDPKATIQPIVVHETDPVAAPGQYNPVAASWAREPVIEPGVELRLIQPGIFNIADLAGTKGRFVVPAEPSRVNVQFQPDGTADPAIFVLTVLPTGDQQDELQQWVILDGITGLCKVREPPTAKQFDGLLAQQTALPDLQFQEKAVEVIAQVDPGEMTLASVLGGGAGGINTLSAGGLQEILSAIQPLIDSAKAGGAGTTNPGTSTPGGSGGRNPGGSAGSGNAGGNNNGNNNDGSRPPRGGGGGRGGGGRGGGGRGGGGR